MTAFLHRNSIIGGGVNLPVRPFAFMLRQPADVEVFPQSLAGFSCALCGR